MENRPTTVPRSFLSFDGPLHLMMIEDNPDDVELLSEAFAESQIDVHIQVAQSSEQALRALIPGTAESYAVAPNLIILDLNMPGQDGRELLKRIKSDTQLRLIPVIIFTGSAAASDVRECYSLHANCYIVKPIEFEKYVAIASQIAAFWFAVATLPQLSREPPSS